MEIQRNYIRTFLVGITAAVALAIPFFSLLTGLSGVFGNNLLGFLLPSLFYIRLKSRKMHWDTIGDEAATFWDCLLGRITVERHRVRRAWVWLGEICLCTFIFCFGIVMLGLGLHAFIVAIVNKYS